MNIIANTLIVLFLLLCQAAAFAQPPQCDPRLTVSSAACARCHSREQQVWLQTPHAQTFETLHRNPRATEIARKMGATSVKRSGICIDCHYTTQLDNKIPRIVEGVSCESCHGAAQEWIYIHSDYGGPGLTRETELPSHRQQRLNQSIALGMRNPRNVYSVARSCLQCHTVPNEPLVNVGGHAASSIDFEFVAWSQGSLRHNFTRAENESNAASDNARLRVMFVAGLLADLEFSTRATALATEKATYGLSVGQRAARAATKLYEVQQLINDAHVQRALQAFASAELTTNNAAQLDSIADQIADCGFRFAESADATNWTALDPLLPKPEHYK